MSKKECDTNYRKMAHAKAMTVAIPKVNRVSEIFKRKPYSSSNYVVHPSEKNRRAE